MVHSMSNTFTEEQLSDEAESFAREFYTRYSGAFIGKSFNKSMGTFQHTQASDGLGNFRYDTYIVNPMNLNKTLLSVFMIYKNKKISKQIVLSADFEQLTKFTLSTINWHECYSKAFEFTGRFFQTQYDYEKYPLIKIEVDHDFNINKVLASFDLCTQHTYTVSSGDFFLYSKPTIDYCVNHDLPFVNQQEFYEFIFLKSYLNMDSLFNIENLTEIEKFLYYIDNKEEFHNLLKMTII